MVSNFPARRRSYSTSSDSHVTLSANQNFQRRRGYSNPVQIVVNILLVCVTFYMGVFTGVVMTSRYLEYPKMVTSTQRQTTPVTTMTTPKIIRRFDGNALLEYYAMFERQQEIGRTCRSQADMCLNASEKTARTLRACHIVLRQDYNLTVYVQRRLRYHRGRGDVNLKVDPDNPIFDPPNLMGPERLENHFVLVRTRF